MYARSIGKNPHTADGADTYAVEKRRVYSQTEKFLEKMVGFIRLFADKELTSRGLLVK
jgi:hypothetical protein